VERQSECLLEYYRVAWIQGLDLGRKVSMYVGVEDPAGCIYGLEFGVPLVC
jgi:hypothetical protein